MKSLIFIFSLPRSGSTLLQRVLMSHKDIASTAEPWLLLPYSYASKKEGVFAEYRHVGAYTAINDFINNLPNKENDYYTLLNDFLKKLYAKQCYKNEKYFLDKTPRYYLIIPEIVKTFPDAKFIFLYRNPLHVASSIIKTWGNGTVKNLYKFDIDLNYGPKALVNGYNLLKDKAFMLNYEQFVSDPTKCTKAICDYLEIEFDKNMLNSYHNQEMKGQMGDPTGNKEYKTISTLSNKKWEETFNTLIKKKIIYKYIKSIDNNVLKQQGYNKEIILEDIKKIHVNYKYLLKDTYHYLYSYFYKYLNANIFFGKNNKKWSRNRFFS